jgi:hypothetical protein
MEQLKVARGLGIPVGATILSWDHLSSKALMHIAPDMTLVWNDVQKREAVEMHGIDERSVVVTGAQCYDQWFERRPSRTREEFCRRVALDPARPIVLYVCSAMSPVPDPLEPHFVKTWVEALRSSADPGLRTAGILIRPHPERMREWNGVTLDGLENVAVHGQAPIDGDAKADYFDSLYFSRAVVGLCTSVFLEAAVVGRPVLTLLLPEYRMHQDGMAHFRYLLNVGGGLLHTAPDLAAHLSQLGEALRGTGRDERNRRFLTSFIRPAGLEIEATPTFVEAVERLAKSPRVPDPAFVKPPSALVSRLALAANHGLFQWLMMDAIDVERAIGERGRGAAKQRILDERAESYARKARERDAALDAKRLQREAKARSKRRRSWSTKKQVARIKGGVKQLIGERHQ